MKKEELISKLTDRQKEYDWSLLPKEFTYLTQLQYICHKKDELGNEHGIQAIKLGKILRGDGCPICRGKGITKELFVCKANFVHNNSYIYDKFEFVDKRTKGTIYCPKHNIEFQQSPTKHLNGQGCPKCRYEKSTVSNTKTTEEFIKEAKKIWGDRWIYTDTEYKSSTEKVNIICPKHGVFSQIAYSHLQGHGCPRCANEQNTIKLSSTKEEFIKKANVVHNSTEDYSLVEYKGARIPIEIICPNGHHYWQMPNKHLCGHGCPYCANNVSRQENDITNFIKTKLNIDVINNNRKLLSNGKELDIFLPSKNIAIEFNGLLWHSEKFDKGKYYHLDKTIACNNKDIRLIHIFEDEWQFKNEIVKSMLMEILNCSPNIIQAANCEIKEISVKEFKNFIETNCIKNIQFSSIRYGLFDKNELVSIIALKKSNYFGNYELLAYCNKLYTNVIGGENKLFNHFIDKVNPQIILTKVDRRWSNGGELEKLGFSFVRYDEPNYSYVYGKHRINKNKIKNLKRSDLYRIYDCGSLCYKWLKTVK